MKKQLFLLLLPFALIDDVIYHNLNSEFNVSNVNYTSNETLFLFQKSILTSSDLNFIGTTLEINNVSYPTYNLSILIFPSLNNSHLYSKPAEGYQDFICNREWFDSGAQFAWRCDFDNDNCAEFENNIYTLYNMTAVFIYKNISETVNVTSNQIQVPQGIQAYLHNASGFDTMEVILDGNLTIVYEINDRGFSGLDCVSSLQNYTINHPYFLSENFTVGGFNKLYFLAFPSLREQWFRNNKFNVVLLSQVPLESAQIFLNGNETRNFSLRNYSTVFNSFGVMEIDSKPNIGDGWIEYYNQTSPFQLELTDHSFAYIYQFNFSYSGLGKNNLSLLITDSFGNSSIYNESLLSRKLSYNGTWDEQGKSIDELSRKSGSYKPGELENIQIALGILSALVLLIFVNYWVK